MAVFMFLISILAITGGILSVVYLWLMYIPLSSIQCWLFLNHLNMLINYSIVFFKYLLNHCVWVWYFCNFLIKLLALGLLSGFVYSSYRINDVKKHSLGYITSPFNIADFYLPAKGCFPKVKMYAITPSIHIQAEAPIFFPLGSISSGDLYENVELLSMKYFVSSFSFLVRLLKLIDLVKTLPKSHILYFPSTSTIF